METPGGNRAGQASQRRLAAALVALMAEKPLRQITVRELTQKAGVSRGTFYFHYNDIETLAAAVEQAHLQQLEQLLDDLMPAIGQDGMPPALPALLHYLNENDDICQALYFSGADPAFTARVKGLLARRCLGYMAPAGGTARQQYLMEFAVNGCFGTIQAWQAGGRAQPPEEIAAIAWQGIRAVREQF